METPDTRVGTPARESTPTQEGNPGESPDQQFNLLRSVVLGDGGAPENDYTQVKNRFLTRPDFACEQPLFAAYFAQKLPASRTEPCQSPVPFQLVSYFDEGETVWIAPERVRSIHLLFAGKSSNPASIFGHVALRLIVCPDSHSTDAQCDANLSGHVVLGYRAHIDELSLDTLKALTGDYKAYLFANRFMDVYQEYAITEFRELYSVPLRLAPSDIHRMVRGLADIHWRFTGEYRFFTKNCATFLQDALRATWPDYADHEHASTRYLRPDSLFETLRDANLLQADVLHALSQAENEGYYFPSTQPVFARAAAILRPQIDVYEFSSADDYIAVSPLTRRLAWAEKTERRNAMRTNAAMRDALLILEEYALQRSLRALVTKSLTAMARLDIEDLGKQAQAKLRADQYRFFDQCFLEPMKTRLAPARYPEGIPAAIPAPPQLRSCRSTEAREALHAATTQIGQLASDDWKELAEISQYITDTVDNVKYLKAAEVMSATQPRH